MRTTNEFLEEAVHRMAIDVQTTLMRFAWRIIAGADKHGSHCGTNTDRVCVEVLQSSLFVKLMEASSSMRESPDAASATAYRYVDDLVVEFERRGIDIRELTTVDIARDLAALRSVLKRHRRICTVMN